MSMSAAPHFRFLRIHRVLALLVPALPDRGEVGGTTVREADRQSIIAPDPQFTATDRDMASTVGRDRFGGPLPVNEARRPHGKDGCDPVDSVYS